MNFENCIVYIKRTEHCPLRIRPYARYKFKKRRSYIMAQSTKCLILLAVIALFFVTEIIPLAVTANRMRHFVD